MRSRVGRRRRRGIRSRNAASCLGFSFDLLQHLRGAPLRACAISSASIALSRSSTSACVTAPRYTGPRAVQPPARADRAPRPATGPPPRSIGQRAITRSRWAGSVHGCRVSGSSSVASTSQARASRSPIRPRAAIRRTSKTSAFARTGSARAAGGPLRVVAAEVSVDSPLRDLAALTPPHPQTCSKGTDDPDKVAIVLAAQIGLDERQYDSGSGASTSTALLPTRCARGRRLVSTMSAPRSSRSRAMPVCCTGVVPFDLPAELSRPRGGAAPAITSLCR